MQKTATGKKLYSATDIVNFLECEHLTALDLHNLEEKLLKAPVDEQAKLIQDKGLAHEASYVNKLQSTNLSFIDISKVGASNEEKAQATLTAMKNGIQIIFQATFLDDQFLGHADFLRRIETPSSLGSYSYEVLDTKLSLSVKAKFVIQLAFYSDFLKKIQGVLPQNMYVVLGNGDEEALKCSEFAEFYERQKQRFLEKVNSDLKNASYPEPCDQCDLCHWRDICKKRWEEDDHLSQVANILKVHIHRLEESGIKTLEQLAKIDPEKRIPKIATPIIKKLHHQARLQYEARIDPVKQKTGIIELIKSEATDLPDANPKGLERLPAPDTGDLFFDMEGNPLEEGGLEYLFGLYFVDNGKAIFKPFWAHSRSEEKIAFEEFMDFVIARLKLFPQAHIYHYAPYEVTALKKLMGLHGTREAAVDDLLRMHKMIDLYRVVREGIRVSEPRYSIKNIEKFYLEKRSGEVTNAGASIVFYEKWKQTNDQKLLQDIEDYNKEDVRSTYELRNWLIKLRPKEMPWISYPEPVQTEKQIDSTSRKDIAEKKLEDFRRNLLKDLAEDDKTWTEADRHRVLTFQLLDFHRRTAKPEWWGVFDRQAMSTEERLDNPECIAGMSEQIGNAIRDAQSMRFTFRYPDQDFKLKTGDSVVLADSLKSINGLVVDEENQSVSFKITDPTLIQTGCIDIAASRTINADVLVNGLFRYAEEVIGETKKYPAIDAILMRLSPSIKGHTEGKPLTTDRATVKEVSAVVASMNSSYLFIQGPPGAGKTYTGSRVILDLLKAGKRVGVTSNSHKAIVNLLHAIEKEAIASNFKFKGVKKSSRDSVFDQVRGELIKDVYDTRSFLAANAQLIAGTAWAMADPLLDQTLDYLFVDEAGQVSLGHLIPAAISSKNIVLLGDQMQLSQPTQGVHPGESGLSVLDFLLKGQSTIAPDRGIFLGTTWRMHPKVCSFISDAVYDSRLQPEPRNEKRQLVLNKDADSSLISAGIKFIPISHQGCTQHSVQEVQIIKSIYLNLLTQSYTDESGTSKAITAENILIVSPYNMQVNKLKLSLPEGARVGTVDKFQGQEAEVVIISMATSSGEDLPRDIEFLFSKNRLNVAVSRAKCLAILIANPSLMDIKCKTANQMSLVNTLCWLAKVSK